MMKDEKEALQRIQQELLKEEAVPEELQTDPDDLERIKDLLGESDSLEQTRLFHAPEELVQEADGTVPGSDDDSDGIDAPDPAPRGDLRMTVLTVTAVLLTLGILGVLLRWVLLVLNG